MKATGKKPYLNDFVCKAEPHWLRFRWVFAAFFVGLVLLMSAAFAPPQDRILLAISGIVLALGALALLYYRSFIEGFSYLAVTNRHLVHKQGVFSEEIRHVPLETALVVQVRRPLLGRLLGYGHVHVMHDGDAWARAAMISNPIDFQRAVTSGVTAAEKPTS